MSDVQAVRIRGLIDSALADDHKVSRAEFNEILAQVKVGWISQDEVDGANAVAAQAAAEVEDIGGIIGSISRVLLEALMNGETGAKKEATRAVEAYERRDAAQDLRKDLDAGRDNQGWMAKKLADWLPEKYAEKVKNLF